MQRNHLKAKSSFNVKNFKGAPKMKHHSPHHHSAHSDHKTPIHHESHVHGGDAPHVARHDHPMHRGPHHDHLIHASNQVSQEHTKGDTALGDKNKIGSLKGEPHGADVTGHNGQMKW